MSILTIDFLTSAVKSVLEDDGFRVDSQQTQAACKVAGDVLEWAWRKENRLTLNIFCKYLFGSFRSCLESKQLKFKTRKTRMWANYHQLRISDTFTDKWKEFLSKSTSEAPPAFFQYVSQKTFEEVVKIEFEVSYAHSVTCEELTYDDKCTLRYIAGYVCRKTRVKLEKSSLPNKNDLIITLFEFRGNGVGSQDTSEDWLDAIDRGGLWHVVDDVFFLFCLIEEEIREELAGITAATWKDEHRRALLDKLNKSEDILFHWATLTYELDDQSANQLLGMMLELYITVRGFAFANSCMELYKQSKKKTVQKSKALRRNVYESIHDD